MPADTWLIYAMGGGWGHLTRSLSLAKAAAIRHHVLIISNCSYLDYMQNDPNWTRLTKGLSIEIRNCAHFNSRDNKAELTELIEREVADLSCSTFIVDSFPRGLLGELQSVLSCRKKTAKTVLVHRDLNPAYAEQYNLREFVQSNFDLVLNPGEGTRALFQDFAVESAPWLIRDSAELDSVNDERIRCWFEPGKNTILICPSGRDIEMEQYVRIAECLAVRFESCNFLLLNNGQSRNNERSNLRQVKYWPAIDLLASSSLVVGSGGYNISNECRALGVPLLAYAQSRMYDRQKLRLLAFNQAIFSSESELVDLVEKAVSSKTDQRQKATFDNGVYSAVREIERLQGCMRQL